MEGIVSPHSDAIVIKANIGGDEIRRLLIDNKSSCDIHYLNAIMKMGIKSSCLKPCAGGCKLYWARDAHSGDQNIAPDSRLTSQNNN